MSYGFVGQVLNNTTKEQLWKEKNKYLLKALKTLSEKWLIYGDCIFCSS
jgi:hypothetical protein